MKQILFVLVFFVCSNSYAQYFETLAPTPPMGWNSWDCFGLDVTEDQVKATADYMAGHMKSAGWQYIVVDIGWYYGEEVNTAHSFRRYPPQYVDEYGRVIPSSLKFPSSVNGMGFKALADYIHSKGLKFGIHIMRGIPWQAVQNNTPIKGSQYKAKDISDPVDTCNWSFNNLGVNMSKPGAQEYYNSIIELYTGWGVDYIKADDMSHPYHQMEIEAISKAVKNAGKPVVLSLSPGEAPVAEVSHLRQNAHLWRISGDVWDEWRFIRKQFDLCRKWQSYVTPHHWPDCDMLPLGKLRINGADRDLGKKNEFSRFSTDEKYTLLSLWYIFRSPLMMGGNLIENDSLTLQLLTNKEALAVNQNSKDNHELRTSENKVVWAADDPASGGKYVALFNIGNQEQRQIEVTWNELGISGKQKVRDLWKQKDLGVFADKFESMVPPHGVILVKISK